MKLYSFFRNGTSHRLRIALRLKGLQVTGGMPFTINKIANYDKFTGAKGIFYGYFAKIPMPWRRVSGATRRGQKPRAMASALGIPTGWLVGRVGLEPTTKGL